mmetsp:Transcript_102896/g.265973  ORF Transcript_102896/g.265973 Transcript_102896/m.265973 type:complete len:378 (+) Transcript_102896:963-2096(+)
MCGALCMPFDGGSRYDGTCAMPASARSCRNSCGCRYVERKPIDTSRLLRRTCSPAMGAGRSDVTSERVRMSQGPQPQVGRGRAVSSQSSSPLRGAQFSFAALRLSRFERGSCPCVPSSAGAVACRCPFDRDTSRSSNSPTPSTTSATKVGMIRRAAKDEKGTPLREWMIMFCGLPIGVHAAPMLAAVEMANENGTNGNLRATHFLMTTGVKNMQVMSLDKKAERKADPIRVRVASVDHTPLLMWNEQVCQAKFVQACGVASARCGSAPCQSVPARTLPSFSASPALSTKTAMIIMAKSRSSVSTFLPISSMAISAVTALVATASAAHSIMQAGRPIFGRTAGCSNARVAQAKAKTKHPATSCPVGASSAVAVMALAC